MGLHAFSTRNSHHHARLLRPPAECSHARMDVAQLVRTVRCIQRVARTEPAKVQMLTTALQAFMGEPRNRHALPYGQVSRGLYTRLLLNAHADPFQIVVVLWGPGSSSPIHDHQGTVGAVALLDGMTCETKYARLGETSAGTRLSCGQTTVLDASTVSPILTDEAGQLHAMHNPSNAWAATVHVYLTPVTDFHIYEPLGDDHYRRIPRQLWFDAENAWRH